MTIHPNVEMRLAGTFLVIAVMLTACVAVGDEPGGDPGSPITTPADFSIDPPALDRFGSEDVSEDSAEEKGVDQSGNAEATVEEGPSDETGDSGVSVTRPDLPDAAFDDYWPSEPMYPGAGIAIPRPRG